MNILSYNQFNNDIKKYTKNTSNNLLDDNFHNFLTIYKHIEQEDLKNPIFSSTPTYQRYPQKKPEFTKKNNSSNKSKYYTTTILTKINIEQSYDVKVKKLINTFFNKINTNNYNKLYDELIIELLKFDNIEILNILAIEIINKSIVDLSYQQIYVSICNRLWCNYELHINLINVCEKNGMFYWYEKNNKTPEHNGVFTNIESAQRDAFIKINFKKYIIDYIQVLFNKKSEIINMSLKTLNIVEEEELIITKKKYYNLIELINVYYNNKYITHDIINIILVSLLNITLSSQYIITSLFELEASMIIFKNIQGSLNPETPKSLNHNSNDKIRTNTDDINKIVFKVYYNYHLNTINNQSLPIQQNILKKYKYFISENIKILSQLNGITNIETDLCSNENNNIIQNSTNENEITPFQLSGTLFKSLDANNITNIVDTTITHIKSLETKELIEQYLISTILNICEKEITDLYITYINSLIDYINQYDVITSIVTNMDDYALDNKLLPQKIKYIQSKISSINDTLITENNNTIIQTNTENNTDDDTDEDIINSSFFKSSIKNKSSNK